MWEFENPYILIGISIKQLSSSWGVFTQMSELLFSDMARGQQKIQSQQKNAKKQAGQKKKQGHDQKAAAKAALIYTCTVCRVRGIEKT